MEDSARQPEIVVACMDRRLPPYLMEKFAGAKFARNAAADVEALKGTLEEIVGKGSPERKMRLHIVCHEDCGGCKVAAATKAHAVFNSEVDEVGARLSNYNFKDQKDLEQKEAGIQEEKARKIFPKSKFPNLEITSECVRLADLRGGDYHGDKRLVVMTSAATDYNELRKRIGGEVGSFYVVQGRYEELIPDIVTAIKLLGVNKVDFVAANDAERTGVLTNMESFLHMRVLDSEGKIVGPKDVRILPPVGEKSTRPGRIKV